MTGLWFTFAETAEEAHLLHLEQGQGWVSARLRGKLFLERLLPVLDHPPKTSTKSNLSGAL